MAFVNLMLIVYRNVRNEIRFLPYCIMQRWKVFRGLKNRWRFQPTVRAAKFSHELQNGRKSLQTVNELPRAILLLENEDGWKRYSEQQRFDQFGLLTDIPAE